VNSLDNDGVNDSELAQSILDEKIMEVLLHGYSFNQEIQTFTPDNTGKIALSRSILRVDGVNDDYYSKFTTRNNYLYDIENSTNVFTVTSVDLLLYRWMDFEEIPLEVRFYIADSAAREYQQATMNDPNRDAVLREKELMSQTNVTRVELDQRDAIWGWSTNGTNRHIRSRRRRDRRY